ncbi:MAG: hypothetical protein ACM3W7_14450 [Acidobacteriota bacterium]
MDSFSRAKRCIMSAVRSRGKRMTGIALGRALWNASLRGYRKHCDVEGHRDFAKPGLKVAVFVDGCFSHGCPRCSRPRQTPHSGPPRSRPIRSATNESTHEPLFSIPRTWSSAIHDAPCGYRQAGAGPDGPHRNVTAGH